MQIRLVVTALILGVGADVGRAETLVENAPASAPSADQASGIAVAADRSDHDVANGILWLPRKILDVVFIGPRYAATGLDYYYESRSPNAFGRDVVHHWRVGFIGEWEARTGASVGARVGYAFTEDTAVDVFGGLFGTRGKSGGARLIAGRFGTFGITPSLMVQHGRGLERVFGGVGDNDATRVVVFQENKTLVTADVAAGIGPFIVDVRADVDSTKSFDDAQPLVPAGDPMPIGYDERDRAGTLELAAILDTRRTSHPWVSTAAPSVGTYVRAAAAVTRGEAARSGDYQYGRVTVEAKQLFDLFHGDRVITIGARTETITDAAVDVPFSRLPGLGGTDRMRALGRNQLRDAHASFADLEYAWPLGKSSRGYVFVETGEVHATWRTFEASELHVGYGGGLKFFSSGRTSMRFQIAGADGEDVGFYAQVGAL